MIVNEAEDWELDYYGATIADKNGLAAILKKIERLLPKEELDKINKAILRRKYDTFRNEIDEDAYSTIEKAFNERKTVEISYFGMNSGEAGRRKVDVYHKTRKYVIAYCHLRSAIRKFRVSRIISAKLTKNTYTVPEGFNKDAY